MTSNTKWSLVTISIEIILCTPVKCITPTFYESEKLSQFRRLIVVHWRLCFEVIKLFSIFHLTRLISWLCTWHPDKVIHDFPHILFNYLFLLSEQKLHSFYLYTPTIFPLYVHNYILLDSRFLKIFFKFIIPPFFIYIFCLSIIKSFYCVFIVSIISCLFRSPNFVGHIFYVICQGIILSRKSTIKKNAHIFIYFKIYMMHKH